MKSLFRTGLRWPKAAVGSAAAVGLVAGVVVSWEEPRDAVPEVRLHAGVAWVASNVVGQLTLLDGASAEVAAGVQVDQPGSALHAAQQGATGYALNRLRGSVVRIDGATLEPSRSSPLVEDAGGELAVFPTPDALYTVDTERGLLAAADPKSLKRQGKPRELDVSTSPDEVVTDADGRLWALDQSTGELVWFADGTRRSRADAATPGESRLAVTGGRPALVDPARGRMQLLDPETGAVEQSAKVNLRRDDTIAVSGSPRQSRLLISVSSRGLLLSCSFDGQCAKPVTVSENSTELGQAVEVGDRAVVPDYATGSVSIVDLTRSRVIAQRQLFDGPVRFDLLTRDGVVFYNDPDSELAGVIDLDGEVRPITKYQPGQHLAGSVDDEVVGGLDDETLPESDLDSTDPDPPSTTSVSISVSPRDHGLVGDEFEFTAVASGAGITSARWTFGDGARATGTTVRHRYERPGTYSVGLTAQLRQGRVVTAGTRVVVDAPGAPPRILRLNVEPEAPVAGQQVRFSADLAGGPPQSMAWTVTSDRGTETTSTAPRFDHVFATPGTYTVGLVVSAGAASDRQSRQFTVAPEPRAVQCGDTITTDAVLTRDLVCPGVGLTIAASDVDLDLGGHTISTAVPDVNVKGIVIRAGGAIRNITVRNGAVSQYPTGIEMTGVAEVTVDAVSVSANVANTNPPAITSERARDVRLVGVTISAYDPFFFNHGSTVVITGSTIRGDTGRGIAKCGFDSSCVIEGGSIHTYGLGCQEDDLGEIDASVSVVSSEDMRLATIGPYCRTATVRDSKVNLLADASAGHTYISGNTISQDREIWLWQTFTITRNVFNGVKSRGLFISSGGGEVSGNQFIDGYGAGILISNDGELPIDHLEISVNLFEHNGVGGDEFSGLDGLRVESAVPGSVIHVSGNISRNNARYGIYAEPGTVTDGGGNTTSGEQGCSGVVCLPG